MRSRSPRLPGPLPRVPCRTPAVPRPPLAAAAAVALLAGLALPGATAPPASAQAGSGYHVVRPGDTVESIAALHGVDPADVRAANGLVDDQLYAGARLMIESTAAPSGSMSTVAATAGTHVVEPGDVLVAIARDHGVTVAALQQANGLDSSLIHPGDQLVVPGATAPSATGSTTADAPRVVCPVPGGSYVNDWGFPRDGGRYHEGTDLFAPRGTPVRAPFTGQLRVGTDDLGGVTFTIDTPSGWRAYGAHLDATIGGDRWVDAGDLIGTVGDSGNAAGGDPHLHLQIDRGAGPVNPYPSLHAAC